MELSYCIVNTDGREHLRACLGAIAATHPDGIDHEILVLDNASTDGSAELVAALAAADGRLGDAVRPIRLERREGKAANDSRLLREARGELCLLLNEDSELLPGATAALIEAMRADPAAGAAGAQLLDPEGHPQPCAWRLPSVWTALAGALFLHRLLVTESGGAETRVVGWAQSAAMLVRRSAAERVGYLDPAFFVYSDETDFCKRLGDAGFHTLYVPAARAIHHEQLSTDRAAGSRRVVEFHRNRDLYFRKHGLRLTRVVWRLCWTWAYLVRAVAAALLPGHDPRRHLLHARQELLPGRGEGIREAAEAHNRALANNVPAGDGAR